jgi:hypothetical protein
VIHEEVLTQLHAETARLEMRRRIFGDMQAAETRCRETGCAGHEDGGTCIHQHMIILCRVVLEKT